MELTSRLLSSDEIEKLNYETQVLINKSLTVK